MNRAVLAMMIAFSCSMMAHAADGPDPGGYQTILVPVFLEHLGPGTGVPGAFGSQWQTEFVARNEADVPVQIFREACVYFCTCVNIECPGGVPVQAHSQVPAPLLPTITPSDGFLLHVQRRFVDQISFSLRIRDVSRTLANAGTDLPIVRERDLHSDTIHLLNIPLDGRYRRMLRLYRVDHDSDGAVLMRIFPLDGDFPVVTVVLRIPAPFRGNPLRPEDDPFPGSLRVDDIRDVFHEELAGIDEVRIDLEPLSPNMALWGFVSLTNNETQFVTVIEPN